MWRTGQIVTDIIAVLKANTSQFTASMAAAQAKMEETGSKGSSTMSKLGTISRAAILGIGAAAVGIGVFAVDMGNKYEDAHAQMVNAFKNAGTSADAYKGKISAIDAQLTKYGYTNAQTQAAIGRLVTVTGNAKGSLNDMGLAADIAKNRGLDLNGAVDLMAKTMAGNITAAKRMGIEIPAAVLKIKDPVEKSNDIMAILENRFKGSASAAADTFSGRVSAMKAQAENLGASLGTKLIPVLEKLMTGIMQVVNYFEKNKTAAKELAIAFGTVLVAAVTVFVGTTIAEMSALDVALGGIPILVGLLVVAIIYLSTHWQQVWSDIKNWVAEGAAWIREHFYLIMAIPMIGWLLVLAANWQGIWNTIKAVMNDAWAVIGPIFNFIKTYGTDIVSANILAMQAIWNGVWTVVSTVVSAAWAVMSPVFGFVKTLGTDVISAGIQALQAVWNGAWGAVSTAVSVAWSIIQPIIGLITGAINGVKDALNWLAGAGGAATAGANTAAAAAAGGATPHRAAGGPLAAGQTALIGEHGPELWQPSSAGTVIPNSALGGGNQMANVAVTVMIDGQEWIKQWQTAAIQYGRGVPTLGVH
jgi:hypothetical protein